MISSSDQALFGLACVLHSTATGNREREAIAIAARLFGEYFREFGREVDENNFDLELILRNIDESNRLILYLQQLPNQTLPITELAERLASRVSSAELWDLDDVTKKQSVAKIFFKSLMEWKEKKAVRSSTKQQNIFFRSGLKLINIYLRNRQYEECLEVMVEIQPFIHDAAVEIQERFLMNSILLELMKPTPYLSKIEELLGRMQKGPKLLTIVMAAFRVG